MEFDLEEELVEILAESSRRNGLFDGRRDTELLVFREFQVASSIPDLVIIRTKKVPGVSARTIRLSAFECWIVGELLRAGRLTLPAITRRMFSTEDRVDGALRKLARSGFVEKTSRGSFVLLSNFKDNFEVVAIEGKLTRWRQAVSQAVSYLDFSDVAFVALPASLIERLPVIREACTTAGVGLISVSRSGASLVSNVDRPSRPDLREWTWVISKAGLLSARY